MKEFGYTSKRVAEAVSGRLVVQAATDEPVGGVSTDSRTIERGDLFVALRGDRFDGHDFLAAAVERGAAVLLVADDRADEAVAIAGEASVVAVPDTLFAFGELARAHRSAWEGTVYCVTGSAGKTTTKDFMAAGLAAAGTVHKTTGNWNNRVGVPTVLLGLRKHHTIAVIEIGTNEPGEIARLAEVVKPDTGVITNIGAAHLEKLGSLDGVQKEKGALFDALPREGVAVINADDERVVAAAAGSRARRITFGVSGDANVRVLSATRTEDGRLIARFDVHGHAISGPLAMLGRHNALDAAAAIACAVVAGVSPEDALAAIGDVVVGSHRLVYVDAGGVNVLDDSYNANPVSMTAALAALAEYAGNGRKVAVLGEMLELGLMAEEAHRSLGTAAAAAGLAHLYAVGPHADAVREAAVAAGMDPAAVTTAEDASAIEDEVVRSLDLGDWVLVKGSRGGRLERVVFALQRAKGA